MDHIQLWHRLLLGLRLASAGVVALAATLGGERAAGAQHRAAWPPSLAVRGGSGAEGPGWRLKPASSTPVCTAIPISPATVSCTTLTAAFVLPDQGPAPRGPRYHQAVKAAPWATLMAPSSWSNQGARETALAEARAPMENGYEPPSPWQVQVDQELFILIADLLGTKLTMRSYGTDLKEVGAWRRMEELEAASRRATYLDVEEYIGHPDEGKIAGSVMAVGLSLTALTGVLALGQWDEVNSKGMTVKVRARGWPPGPRIKGTFNGL